MASKLAAFLAELKRRKVYHVGIAYAVIGAILGGVANDFLPNLGAPSWAIAFIILLILLGLPIALVLAWAYEVRPEEEEPPLLTQKEILSLSGSDPSTSTTAAEQRKSIVVLPFDNLSPDPGDAYFSDGLTEEVITKLSYIRSMRVVSRTSAMALRDTQKNARAIAEELGVQYVLEGSVRKAGTKLRITAQLIEAKADEHLWAESYDRDLEDIFHVQTDVAETIARVLRTEFSETEQERVRRIPTGNLRAYNSYVRAHQAAESFMPEDLADAEELVQEAIRLDPEFAQAHAALAELCCTSGFYANERPSHLYPKMAAAATRALELDPLAGEAHVALALNRYYYEWDWDGAEVEWARALELSPDYSYMYRFRASVLWSRGRFQEAEAAVRRGLVLDPLSPSLQQVLGEVLAASGRLREAVQWLEGAVKRWPKYPLLHTWLGIACMYAGEPEAGLRHAEAAHALSSDIPFIEAIRGILLVGTDRMAEAREVLEDLKASARNKYVDPYNLFTLTVALDGFDAAVPYLDEAVEVRSFFVPYLGVTRRFRPFHSVPRFRGILDRVHPGVVFEA
jgi:serine/threonine-protein kinase